LHVGDEAFHNLVCICWIFQATRLQSRKTNNQQG
jgi:hypothetical protein